MQSFNVQSTIEKQFPLLTHGLDLLYEEEKQIPSSVQFSIQRYKLQQGFNMEEIGMLAYNYQPKVATDRNIELRFCVTGNQYCRNEDCSAVVCKKISDLCASPYNTIDVFNIQYPSTYLAQFFNGKPAEVRSDQLLRFKEKQSFTTTVSLCNRTKNILSNILQQDYQHALSNIYLNSQLQILLLYGLECLVEEKAEESFVCRFLANDDGQEKINQARAILIERIGEPITIKELSKKVGTNECYLKKGFKEMFGTTIFDFYQNQRMEHAKYLLYEKGLRVTEVSDLLGYSSISHFSTAFKKHTGLKPCELLFRS